MNNIYKSLRKRNRFVKTYKIKKYFKIITNFKEVQKDTTIILRM